VFVEADAQCLPFPDEHFQLVTVAFGLRNIADADRGLREMVRVCQPGGKVAVLEFTTPRRWPLSSVYRWYFRRVLPRIGQALSRSSSSAYEYLPDSVNEFPSYEALAERMRSAGLYNVSFTPMTFGVATLYVGVKQASNVVERSHNSQTTQAFSIPELAAP
jgi:demethylmenaquinone methyltransferase/2-methoxy-6-polyprenyl-1,4-benzoquinol methylase